MKKFFLEQLSGLAGLIGIVAMACEASSYGGQIKNGVIGLLLLALSWLFWKLSELYEAKHRRARKHFRKAR